MCIKFSGVKVEKQEKHVEIKDGVDGSEVLIIDYNINKATNLNSEQSKFLKQCLHYQCQVLSSSNFKYRFLALNATHLGGRTLQDIHKQLIEGRNNLSKAIDYDLDYIITLYKPFFKNTLGYHSKGKIFTNRLYFNRAMKQKAYNRIAGHLFHEYMHSLSLFHSGGNKKKSIVYQGGNLMREMVLEVINGKKLTKLKIAK